MAKRVAIIGAGCSGLASIKSCLEEGLQPVCFEQDADIGGLWRFSDKEGHSSIYRSTVINTSRELMPFSDFLIPHEWPTFLHNSDVYKYFQLYADKFGLRKYIHFETAVRSVVKSTAGAGKWDVAYESKQTGARTTDTFDAVFVCSGHHWDPYTAEFPGASTFEGSVSHSHAYKDFRPFEGKSTVIIGIGNSGVDLAVELSRHCPKVSLSTRSGAWVIPRSGLSGLPADHVANSRYIALLPLSLRSWIGEVLIKFQQGNMRSFGIHPDHRLYEAHPTVNSELIGRIASGAVAVRPNIARIQPRSVVYVDGTQEPCDAIVYCTGYRISFPFLDGSLLGLKAGSNTVELYKHVVPPQNSTLFFIGLVQPLGALMPISEIQSRWTARLVSGAACLPSTETMLKDIEAKRVAMRRRYRDRVRHTIQVDYIPIMDEFAELIGCKPPLLRLFFTNPRLWSMVVFGPASPPQYRLYGPGAWEGAPKAIEEIIDNVFTPYKSGGGAIDQKEEKAPSSVLGRLFRVALVAGVVVAVGHYKFGWTTHAVTTAVTGAVSHHLGHLIGK